MSSSFSALAVVSAQTIEVPRFGMLAPLTGEIQLDQHPPSVYLSSLSAGSRRAMRGALETIAAMVSSGQCDFLSFPWSELRFQHCQAVRSALDERYAVATANRMLCALKGTLKAAWRLGQIPTEEFQRAVDLPSIRGSSLPKGRALKAREMDRLLETIEPDTSPAGLRDYALLALLAGVGLRRSEIVALDLADYDAQSGEVRVRSGKGNKERITYAGADARDAMDFYLEKRGEEAGPLFLPTRGGRSRKDGTRPTAGFTLRRLTDQAVWHIAVKRAKQAKVTRFSPHDMRRTWASNLLAAGADIATVQKLAGHSSVVTTARYDFRGEGAKREAAELIHLGRRQKRDRRRR